MADDRQHGEFTKVEAELASARSRRDDARRAAVRATALHEQIAESTQRCEELAAALSKGGGSSTRLRLLEAMRFEATACSVEARKIPVAFRNAGPGQRRD